MHVLDRKGDFKGRAGKFWGDYMIGPIHSINQSGPGGFGPRAKSNKDLRVSSFRRELQGK